MMTMVTWVGMTMMNNITTEDRIQAVLEAEQPELAAYNLAYEDYQLLALNLNPFTQEQHPDLWLRYEAGYTDAGADSVEWDDYEDPDWDGLGDAVW